MIKKAIRFPSPDFVTPLAIKKATIMRRIKGSPKPL